MTDHDPRPSLALGGLYISLSMLAGALLSGLVKWASVGFSSEFIVAVRFTSGLLVFAALLAMRPRVSLRTSQWQTQMAVAVSWALATLIFFYSIRFIRLMDAALLLVAANEPCPAPQTAEHLHAALCLGLRRLWRPMMPFGF